MPSTRGVGGDALPSAWEIAIAGWLAYLRACNRPETTIRTRRGQVRRVALMLRVASPLDVNVGLLVSFLSEQKWSADHRKGTRSALIDFFEWCCREGHADHNPAEGLPKVAGSPPKPRPATDDIWDDIIAAAEPRELMMARLACEVGMRRTEVALVHSEDLVNGIDGYSLIVHGKGGKQRVVPITDDLAAAIRRYRPVRGYLFPGQIDGHISPMYVGKLISRLMPPGWSMHKLRHRYATKGLLGTGNIRAVQEALGHASVATTERYTAVAARDLRAVADAAAAESRRPKAVERVARPRPARSSTSTAAGLRFVEATVQALADSGTLLDDLVALMEAVRGGLAVVLVGAAFALVGGVSGDDGGGDAVRPAAAVEVAIVRKTEWFHARPRTARGGLAA